MHLTVMARLVSLGMGYCCGLILMGYILGKLFNRDLRRFGSGNVGTTNAARVLGKAGGLITMICDIGKGLLAAGAVYLIFRNMYPDGIRLLMVYGAFGAVLGHDFPVYMGFKGGKGVATSIAFLGVVNPATVPAAVFVFLLAVMTTRYVSLGSILGALSAVILVFFGAGLKAYEADAGMLLEVKVMVLIAATLVIVKHRENIIRLIRGTENPLTFGKVDDNG